MFVTSLFVLLFVTVLCGLVCAVAASLRDKNGPTRRALLSQPHLSRTDSIGSVPIPSDPSTTDVPLDTPAPLTVMSAVSQPEGLGDEVLHGGRERGPSDPRIAALEREVLALRETVSRSERLDAEIAARTQRPFPSSPQLQSVMPPPEPAGTLDAPGDSDVSIPTQPPGAASLDDAAPVDEREHDALSLYDTLHAEIERAPLDTIARRRLHSELETWQRRGGNDDGLLVGLRHDLQSARSEPSIPSLFEAQRPRNETERLRADLALRERQNAELLNQVSSLRATPPAAEQLHDPFDRVPRRDDLRIIKGIGKRMERVLNELGVTTLAQLAAFEQSHIDRVARRLDGQSDDITSENWVGQARRILARRRKRYEAG